MDMNIHQAGRDPHSFAIINLVRILDIDTFPDFCDLLVNDRNATDQIKILRWIENSSVLKDNLHFFFFETCLFWPNAASKTAMRT
jgi:hypothetical protein